MKQLPKEDWDKRLQFVGCGLGRSYLSVFEKFRFELEKDVYDIFGNVLVGCFLMSSGQKIGVMLSVDVEKLGIDIFSYVDSPEEDIFEFLDCLGLAVLDLEWIHPDLKFSKVL
ncbi:hypothetical protein [Acanthopleuribacter pedis]|uniref:Uncharacterized protein n=1 Tax=Acanthopleuribacter pedis TaxID=442870 RepID=A0A8J7QKA5_9BACT|nr:hypothetical protein [Acanthopleuribacter pedis]MBO1319690.1 hypothetical protein [Acanthopleuribacter pedis]